MAKISTLINEGIIEKISYMSVAPMSRLTIGATFRLYLKNQRKAKLGH